VVIAARQGLQSSYNAALFVSAVLSVIRNKTVKESYSSAVNAYAACNAVRSNANARNSVVGNEKVEEDDSWEEKRTQRSSTAISNHDSDNNLDITNNRSSNKTNKKEEEEEVIRKMNQCPIPNEEGKIRRELIASIVVQDWPWTAENA
jgi:hypothetical protein